MTFEERLKNFDKEHQDALRSIWFLGDVHGEFRHIAETLLRVESKPNWLVFLGDIDIDHRPFCEVLEPLHRAFPAMQVAFIHGNHDGDSPGHWKCTVEQCGKAMHIHGQVVDMGGVRVAGLGGNFMGRVWAPPNNPTFKSLKEATQRGAYQYRDGQRPASFWNAAIYPEDVDRLAKKRADILITHEAPSCHPHGWAELDELSRSMGVLRTFHGHHHDDLSDQYALDRETRKFDARGVSYCSITNGLGERILEGPKGW